MGNLPIVHASANPRSDGDSVHIDLHGGSTVCLIADSQLGTRSSEDEEWYQVHSLRLCVSMLNLLKPSCVFHLGDITNRSRNASQIRAYAESVAELDAGISLFHVPGNHDVHDHTIDSPTRGRAIPETWTAFHRVYGAGYFTVESEAARFVILCSSLIYDGAMVREVESAQLEWLEAILDSGRADAKLKPTFILQHWPFYISDPDEENDYLNLPNPLRRRYLDLFVDSGATAVFYGHLHRNEEHLYRSLPLVCTSSIGAGPLSGDDSARGFRLLSLGRSFYEHRFYGLGEIPVSLGSRRLGRHSPYGRRA